MEAEMRGWIVGVGALLSQAALAQTPAPRDAELYIIYPQDGQKISGAFPVRFGLKNMGITRAGDTTPNVGHHHLLVNVDASGLDRNAPIPTDRRHLHFGGGQTETLLDLAPGNHTLQLVLGDAEHKIFSPPVISKKITVTVLDSNAAQTPVVRKNATVRKRTPARKRRVQERGSR
jgi:Domain of unknown function (DUF4399)